MRGARKIAGWTIGLAACGFSPTASTVDGGQIVGDSADSCGAPATTTCAGRTLRTCGVDHQWDTTADKICDFTCSAGSCVAASNVPLSDVAACAADAPALAPSAGATIAISNSGGTHIDCSPNCGDVTVTRIDAAKTTPAPAPGYSLFCLSRIEIAGATQLSVAANTSPAEAIVFVVDGEVSIGGIANFDGEGAGSGTTASPGGPGGYAGAALSNNSGNDGQGPCHGRGGSTVGPQFSDHYSGGGGGGAGNASPGGDGGTGSCNNGDHHGQPGEHGELCGTDELTPLIGGSGGGGGGDATNGVAQGWGGGGGGGVLQISSRRSIAVSGSISARGGAGFGTTTIDGGSGGGAGGGILLEAPSLLLTGQLNVDGGSGGLSKSGPGGNAASGANTAGTGVSYSSSGQGGSGGGGGGGRIRIVGANPTCVGGVSPNTACTTGSLAVVN